MKTIRTRLFNKDILDSVIGQLSDGIWENSRACEKYWQGIKIEEDDNGEILIKYNFGLFYTDEECKKYMANKLKQIVKKEQELNNSDITWKRDCEIKLDYFHGNTTVAQVYDAYDTLLGRK